MDVVKALLKPKSVKDIQVFFEFANLYHRFIQSFSKIAALLTSMSKTRPQVVSTLPATGIDNSTVIDSSSRNNRKYTKSDFTNSLYKAKNLIS